MTNNVLKERAIVQQATMQHKSLKITEMLGKYCSSTALKNSSFACEEREQQFFLWKVSRNESIGSYKR